MTTDIPKPLVLARWEIRPRDGGAPIRGDLRSLRGPPPRTAVVICHGFKGFREWAFFPSLARAIARRGHAAVTFDLSTSGIGPDGRDFSALDLFSRQTHSGNVREIRRVLDAVASGPLFPRPPERIALLGFSRGGGEAVLVAADDHRVDALVTWSAIASVDRSTPEQIATWKRGQPVFITNSRTRQEMPVGPEYWADLERNRDRLDIARAAGRVRVPWLIAHGDVDETVDPADARVLYAAAGPGAELLLIPGGSHTYGAAHPFRSVPGPLEAVARATCDWLDETLAPAPRGRGDQGL